MNRLSLTLVSLGMVLLMMEHGVSGERKTASAIIHEDDGIWGSIVFHQWKKQSAVVISLLFRDVKMNGYVPTNYQIWDEPVHYDWYTKEERCSSKALKTVMRVKGSDVGNLGMRHRLMTSSRFAEVVYDKKLSLYDDEEHNIIGKTFVVQQGSNESDYRCATIYETTLHSLRPGAIPCEVEHYSDCVLGTSSNESCVVRGCYGYKQYWGEISDSTLMCMQVHEVYPKRLDDAEPVDGLVRCLHGNHTLLRPLDANARLI